MKISLLFIALCLTQVLYSQINITKNTIWDGNDPSYPPPSSISGDITINTTYTLTIRNWSMTMPENSEIIVNRNAKPFIKNSSISNLVNIYPNPANSVLYISLNCDIDVSSEISIFDLNGRLIKQSKIKSENDQISLSELSDGVYFIRVFVNNEITTHKLVVTK